MAKIGLEGRQFTLLGYLIMRVVVDYVLTETPTGSVGSLVGSSTALVIVLGERPVEAARYRNEKAGYEAYVIRQYLEPQLVQNNAIDKICT